MIPANLQFIIDPITLLIEGGNTDETFKTEIVQPIINGLGGLCGV